MSTFIKMLAINSLYILLFNITVQAQDTLLTCANENTAIKATTDHLIDNYNGTISDHQTGLIWKKCIEGRIWNKADNSCEGDIVGYSWKHALQRAQSINSGSDGESLGLTGWRLPNIKELGSIVELRCFDPAINLSVFPNTISTPYWSSSPHISDTVWAKEHNKIWYIEFHDGTEDIKWYSKSGTLTVRLVRIE